MTWANNKPWQEVGVDVPPNRTAREMLGIAKIGRQVSNNKRLKSIENEKAFRFFKSFTEAGDANIETIGHLENERIVWALARLNEDFTLNEVDKVQGYLLLASRNETRESIQIQFMAMRMAGNCMFPVTVKTRATFANVYLTASKFDPTLDKKASATLALGRAAISAFAPEANRLANIKVDVQMSNRFMFDVFQPETSRDLPSIGQQEIEEHADEKTRCAIEAIENAPGQDMKTAQMTAWGLLNAVIHTVDHRLGKSQDFRLRQAWFGANANVKQRALDLAFALPG